MLVKAPTQAELQALANKTSSEETKKASLWIDQFVDGLTGLALRERAAFSPTCNIAGLLSGYTVKE